MHKLAVTMHCPLSSVHIYYLPNASQCRNSNDHTMSSEFMISMPAILLQIKTVRIKAVDFHTKEQKTKIKNYLQNEHETK